ncbi:MAG: helix-turn-helix domain-containing protein, partial [Candidatus Methylomirabilales bacterium]
MGTIVTNVGMRIRELRKRRGLTLKAVADHARVTPSLMSQLERGKVNPSLSLLSLVASRLQVSVASLLETDGLPESGPPVLRRGKRKTLFTEGSSRLELLSRHFDLNCEFTLNEWQPGDSTGKDQVTHEGVECGFVIRGKLRVELGGEAYTLVAGDSIT